MQLKKKADEELKSKNAQYRAWQHAILILLEVPVKIKKKTKKVRFFFISIFFLSVLFELSH